MILSKLLPKPNKRGAVFTSLGLIILGMIVARILPDEIPDNHAYLDYILATAFLLLSWDVVNDMVGGAIDDAAEEISAEKIEEKIQNYDEKLRKYQEENTAEGIFRRQEQEYRLAILCSRHPEDYELRITEDPSLTEKGMHILACESITRGLAIQDIFLRAMATRACQYVSNKTKATQKELEGDPNFLNFRKDIYIYLKAWLMLSIRNHREMDPSTILQTSLNRDFPDPTAHIQALIFIRDYLIDDELLNQYLEQRYRKIARVILKNYLTKLVDSLTLISQRKTSRNTNR